MINAIKFKIAPDTGRLIENLTAIELLRRGKEVYYYKTKDGKEVDFAVNEDLKISQLIQVCYDINHYMTKKRETNALVKADREILCSNLIVLTWDYEAREKSNDRDIHYLPLWKWLIA